MVQQMSSRLDREIVRHTNKARRCRRFLCASFRSLSPRHNGPGPWRGMSSETLSLSSIVTAHFELFDFELAAFQCGFPINYSDCIVVFLNSSGRAVLSKIACDVINSAVNKRARRTAGICHGRLGLFVRMNDSY